jgi:hypothetical protein
MFDKMKHQRQQKKYHIAGSNCYPKAKINKVTGRTLVLFSGKSQSSRLAGA